MYERRSEGSSIAEYKPNVGELLYLLSDTDGFTTPEYYRIVLIAEVGSLLYINARDPLGIHLASFNLHNIIIFTQSILTNTEWMTFGYYTRFMDDTSLFLLI